MTYSTTVDLFATGGRASGLDILILDDNEIDRIRLRRYLDQAGVTASIIDCSSVENFSNALDHTFFDAVLIDYRLGANTGIEAVNLLRQSRAQRKAAAIMVTGDHRIDLAVEAMRMGCDDFVIKDALDPHRMRMALARAISHRKADTVNAPAGPSPALTLRDAMEAETADMAADLRSALNTAVGRTRALRRSNSDDPHLLGQLAYIDAACARAWQTIGQFEQKMAALDVARPRTPKLGFSRKRTAH